MIVYRVEEPVDQQGPYRDYDKWDRFGGGAPNHRPCFERPIGAPSDVPWGEEYRFAFSSIQQFRQWFDSSDERRKLADLGFVLSVYDVDVEAVVASRCRAQVVFKPNAARLVERYNLLEGAAA